MREMAGSIGHCVGDDPLTKKYRGYLLLENMGDMKEGVQEMMFVILSIWNSTGGDAIVPPLIDHYYECLRGERPWPEFMRAGVEADDES